MTIFWSMDKPLTASEILQHRKEGTWAANSIHPLLNKLLENGYIVVCGSQRVAKVNSRLYEAKVSLPITSRIRFRRFLKMRRTSSMFPPFYPD